MQKNFLKELGLDDEVVEKIMKENDSDIEKEKAKTIKAELERDSFKEQLETTKETLKTYEDMDIESIKKSAKEWQDKYNADTKALQDKINEQAYETAAKDYLGQFKFSNKRVAESIKSDFKSKGFKLENGKFLGADDYMKDLQESEPDSFVKEDDKTPTFVKPTGNSKTDKKMSIMEAMKYKNEHPDVDIRTLI